MNLLRCIALVAVLVLSLGLGNTSIAHAVCGDNVREGSETCDGTDDSACSGECLPPGGPNECTCRDEDGQDHYKCYKARKFAKRLQTVSVEDQFATMGITEYAQEQLGDVVYVELPEVGKQVKRMEEFAVVESVKAASDIFSPLSGEVVEVNKTLDDAPELLNKEP